MFKTVLKIFYSNFLTLKKLILVVLTLAKTGQPFPAGAVKAGQTTSVFRTGQPDCLKTGQPPAASWLKAGQADCLKMGQPEAAEDWALKGQPEAAAACPLKGQPEAAAAWP